MVEHLLVSLAWVLVVLAVVVVGLAILLWLAGVALDWIAAYRLRKWARQQNAVTLQDMLRKRSL